LIVSDVGTRRIHIQIAKPLPMGIYFLKLETKDGHPEIIKLSHMSD